MKSAILAVTAAAGLALAACTPTQVATTIGAVGGAAVGAGATGNLVGVTVGTIIGGAGGFIVGQIIESQQTPAGVCYVRDQQGRMLYYDQYGNVVVYQTPWPVTVQC